MVSAWEQEILDANKNTADYHREVLPYIPAGSRIVLDDIDVTEEERKKEKWYVAHIDAATCRQ